MSHTTKVDDWTLIHDGDYTGVITVISPDGKELDIPFEVFAEIAGGAAQVRATERLENMTGREYLDSIS